MSEPVIAVASGEFRFSLEELTAAARHKWPRAAFVPASGQMASVSLGQFQIPDAASRGSELLVEVDVQGRALDLDCPDNDLAAEFIATATSVPDFPGDGSVILAEWATEFVTLRPNMTAEEILAARN
jgi:hypothetical protein